MTEKKGVVLTLRETDKFKRALVRACFEEGAKRQQVLSLNQFVTDLILHHLPGECPECGEYALGPDNSIPLRKFRSQRCNACNERAPE